MTCIYVIFCSQFVYQQISIGINSVSKYMNCFNFKNLKMSICFYLIEIDTKQISN